MGCLALQITPVSQCQPASTLRRAVAYSSISDAANSCAYDSVADISECTPGMPGGDADDDKAEAVEVSRFHRTVSSD